LKARENLISAAAKKSITTIIGLSAASRLTISFKKGKKLFWIGLKPAQK